MINTLLGTKKSMTSSYDARGRRVGVTMIEITPNWVTQVKTQDGKDGYNAVQLGFGEKKSTKKPQLGIAKKAGIDKSIRYFKEIKTEEDLKPGQEIKLPQVFSIGDAVKVTGISKGKGFQGGVRRHGFAGGPKTHGQSDRHRAPGSIGQTTTPGRVYKGKRMAGHMGMEKVTVRNLEVVGIDKTRNLLLVKGAVSGATGSLLTVQKLGHIKGYTPPPEEKPDEEEQSSGKNQELSDKVETVTVEKSEEGAFSAAEAKEDKEDAESK